MIDPDQLPTVQGLVTVVSPRSRPADPGPANSRALPLYLTGASAARLSDDGTATAIVLLALQRTGDARFGGLLLAVIMVPQILAGPAVGALVDRSRRPGRLFLAGFLVLAGMQLTLMLTTGNAPVPVPLAAALTAGVVSPLVTGGLTSLLADIVPAGPRLRRAQSLDSVTYSAASVIAPLAAAALSAATSPAFAMGAFAAAAGMAAVVTAALPLQAHQPAAVRPTLRSALRRGAGLLWRNRRLSAVTVATTGSFLGIGALPLTLAVYARALGEPANRGGFLYSAFALGALGTSLLISAHPPARIAPESMVLGCLAGCGATLAAAGALLASLPAALLVIFAAGAVEGPVLAMTFAVRAEESPPGLRTQVFATAASLKITAAAAGSALAGVASVLDGHRLLLGTGLLQVVSAACGAAVLLTRGAASRAERDGEPGLAVPASDRSRPADAG